MKKFKREKVLSLLLGAAMMLSLAACGSASNEESKNTGTADSQEKVQTEEKQVSDEIPTFQVLAVRSSEYSNDFVESGIWVELEEKHGIDIEWIFYNMEDWNEQKSLLLASGDLPDAFFGPATLADSDIAQNPSYFLDLTDLIDENMPNFKKALEQDAGLRGRVTNREGRILSLGRKLPLRPVTSQDIYINVKWLDNLGLEMPATVDELTAVLKAFATEDADLDGDTTDEVPWNCSSDLGNNLNTIMLPFGTSSNYDTHMAVDEDGNPFYVPASENYKNAVAWMHDLYESGVIKEEYFTDSDWYAPVSTEGSSHAGALRSWALTPSFEHFDEFQVLEYVTGPDGERYCYSEEITLNYSNRAFTVTTQCENPEKLLQWVDDFYTNEVTMQAYWGKIGEGVTDNGDGTYTINEVYDEWKITFRDDAPMYMDPAFYENIIFEEGQADGLKLEYDKINNKYVDIAKVKAMPPLSYTEDELVTRSTIQTDLNQCADSYFAHWVVDGGVEEEWEDYLKQLDVIGLQEFLEIERDAYAYYLEVTK